MRTMIVRCIQALETKLSAKHEPFKKMQPFDLGAGFFIRENNSSNSFELLLHYLKKIMAGSDEFFSPPSTSQYSFANGYLTYPSPINTETNENNTVLCRLFEAKRRDRVVIILPHWNASGQSYDRLSNILRASGISALRMTLPYHDERRSKEMVLAEYMVSSNIGRTISSFRQAVLEVRLAIDWLEERGYKRIGIIGMSLGSAVGQLVASHDHRINIAAFLLIASCFAESVWVGDATKHIKEGIADNITLNQLDSLWSIISPINYVSKLRDRPVLHFILSAQYDRVFPPYLTKRIIQRYRDEGISHIWKHLSCGHYTLGFFPFNIIAVSQLIKFLRAAL